MHLVLHREWPALAWVKPSVTCPGIDVGDVKVGVTLKCSPHALRDYNIIYIGKFSRVVIFTDVGFQSFFCVIIIEDLPWDKATHPNFTNPHHAGRLAGGHTLIIYTWVQIISKSCETGVKCELHIPCLNYEAVLWRRWSVTTTSIKALGRLNLTCIWEPSNIRDPSSKYHKWQWWKAARGLWTAEVLPLPLPMLYSYSSWHESRNHQIYAADHEKAPHELFRARNTYPILSLLTQQLTLDSTFRFETGQTHSIIMHIIFMFTMINNQCHNN